MLSRPSTAIHHSVRLLVSLGLGFSVLGLARPADAASTAKTPKSITLGHLGQALRDVGIHSRQSIGSHVYYHSKQYQYLVVSTKPGGASSWVSVLMSNGMHGYVPADAVAVLPYKVTQTVAARAPRSFGRSGYAVGSSSASRGAVARYSLNFLGTPYQWGGNDPVSGIDCSGFVKKMFGQIGVNLPRTAAEQVNYGQPVERLEELQAGDRLYFWEAKRNKIGHTGIYLGNGYFVHSSSGKGGVATSYLSKGWQKLLVAARR